jgi:hypothetical protein
MATISGARFAKLRRSHRSMALTDSANLRRSETPTQLRVHFHANLRGTLNTTNMRVTVTELVPLFAFTRCAKNPNL